MNTRTRCGPPSTDDVLELFAARRRLTFNVAGLTWRMAVDRANDQWLRRAVLRTQRRCAFAFGQFA